MRKPQRWISPCPETEGRIEGRALNIVSGLIDIADGLIVVCTLGHYGAWWSFDYTVWRLRRSLRKDAIEDADLDLRPQPIFREFREKD